MDPAIDAKGSYLGLQKSPVSAIAWLDQHDLLLVGSGGYLEAFDLNSPDRILSRSHVFKQVSNNVHRIVPSKTTEKVHIIGGKTLMAVEIAKDKSIRACPEETLEFEDWIFDVTSWKNQLFVISAHNDVFAVNTNEQRSLEKIQCQEEKCILYSASLVAQGNEVIVLGGTVFSQVIIWACAGPKRGAIFHRLNGHEGVIFNVQFDNTLSLICSTSDDRSARLWKVKWSDDK